MRTRPARPGWTRRRRRRGWRAGRRPARGRTTARGMEDLDRLGQAEDAGEQRDLLALHATWLATAVPVLVERADGVRRRLAQPCQQRDLRAALAARLHQQPRDLA